MQLRHHMRPIDHPDPVYYFGNETGRRLRYIRDGHWRKAMDLIVVFGISALLCVAMGLTCSGKRAD
jgi:hypothetical protein